MINHLVVQMMNLVLFSTLPTFLHSIHKDVTEKTYWSQYTPLQEFSSLRSLVTTPREETDTYQYTWNKNDTTTKFQLSVKPPDDTGTKHEFQCPFLSYLVFLLEWGLKYLVRQYLVVLAQMKLPSYLQKHRFPKE